MKSTQRRMWSLVPWANAGARPAARIPATPVTFRNVRRSIEASFVTGRLAFIDLLELGLGPLQGVLGLHALGGLRVHVDDDVLRVPLVHLEPLAVVLLLVHPGEEVLGRLLVLAVLHQGVLERYVERGLTGGT